MATNENPRRLALIGISALVTLRVSFLLQAYLRPAAPRSITFYAGPPGSVAEYLAASKLRAAPPPLADAYEILLPSIVTGRRSGVRICPTASRHGSISSCWS